MKLLIVNDITIEADTMAKDIPWKDYGIDEVFTAYSAGGARKIIGHTPIDILLSDIEMPEEDGLSLIHWIQDAHYDIDCVLLTCHADFAYAREGLSLGCQDYITLPAKYEEIGASIAKVCRRRQEKLASLRLQDYGRSWLINQTGHMDQETETSTHDSPQELVEKSKAYILDHISDCELSVTDVAANIYLNPIYLNRVFKKETGINMSQWIIKERMELASTLFLTTRHTANEIALQVGYNNYPYFSTVFKKYFHCTPSQYVRQAAEPGTKTPKP